MRDLEQQDTTTASSSGPTTTTSSCKYGNNSITSETDYLDYHVELRGGDGYSYGNVFATNINGYLGPVCDDHWTSTEATTVCR